MGSSQEGQDEKGAMWSNLSFDFNQSIAGRLRWSYHGISKYARRRKREPHRAQFVYTKPSGSIWPFEDRTYLRDSNPQSDNTHLFWGRILALQRQCLDDITRVIDGHSPNLGSQSSTNSRDSHIQENNNVPSGRAEKACRLTTADCV